MYIDNFKVDHRNRFRVHKAFLFMASHYKRNWKACNDGRPQKPCDIYVLYLYMYKHTELYFYWTIKDPVPFGTCTKTQCRLLWSSVSLFKLLTNKLTWIQQLTNKLTWMEIRCCYDDFNQDNVKRKEINYKLPLTQIEITHIEQWPLACTL